MSLRQSIHQLLKDTGPGRMTNTAYDTAWVARLGDLDWTLSHQALDWLCENQLPDGSWGAAAPEPSRWLAGWAATSGAYENRNLCPRSV